MPGSQDQGDQPELPTAPTQDGAPRADSPVPGDRPVPGSVADLRRRQEGLANGHPSSRYHDDGSLKSALVPLKNLELPLPGEERGPDGATGRDAADPPAAAPRADDRAVVSQADAGAQADADGQADAVADDAEPGTGPESDAGDRQTAGRERAAGEHEAAGEHDGEASDQQAAPGREASLDEGGPATQDQETVVDDQAPPPVEQLQAGRGERLTPEQVRLAVRALGQCRLAEGRNMFGAYGEHGLTPAMRSIEDELEHGELVPETEKYALKSLDRFQEKLANLIERNPDKSPEELAHEIHDGVRYTFVFSEAHYYDATWQLHNMLEEQGFDLEFQRNTWTDPEYKGVNSRWHDPDHDIVFEVQFHTMASWDAKQRNHDAYARISDKNTLPAERKQLRATQKEVSATVPLPPRCTEIPDYRKEGK